MAQSGGARARFKLLLSAQRQFVLEQQPEPFGMIEGARLGFVLEVPEPLGEAVETEGVQLVEGRMGKHGMSSQWK
jgi:hypothetical protein